ncbi:MAG: DUF2341 domain-containing protein [Candidatus Hodarchaeales archaeon]
MRSKQNVFTYLLLMIFLFNFLTIAVNMDNLPKEKKEKVKIGQKIGQKPDESITLESGEGNAKTRTRDKTLIDHNDDDDISPIATDRDLSRSLVSQSSSPASSQEDYVDAVTDNHLPTDQGTYGVDWTRLQATDGSNSTLVEYTPTGNHSTAWYNASSFTNNTGWDFPANMYSSDDTRAHVKDDLLDVVLYDFNLPDLLQYTISGIEVQVEGFYEKSPPGTFYVSLLWNGRTNETIGKDISLPKLVGAEDYRSAGGTTDTWDRTWNGTSDFSNANFGVKLTGITTKDFYIDHVQIKLFYETDDNDFDREFSFTNVAINEENLELCILTGQVGTETMYVDTWNVNSSSWTNIMSITDSDDYTWKNVSLTSYLYSNDLHFRFVDSEKIDFTNDSWEIDSILISYKLAYSDFFLRKNITIDHTEVNGTLTNFPILVDIYDADLHVDTQPDGDDIMFANANGEKLAHEIEFFDQAGNGTHARLVAWINVPNLSNVSDTIISMYYKNTTKGNQENSVLTWEEGFLTVHHMEEKPNETIFDSTGTFNMSSSGSMDLSDLVDGVIGNGVDFDGSNDLYLSASSMNLSGSFTFSCWLRVDAFDHDQTIISLDNDSTDDRKMWIKNTDEITFTAKYDSITESLATISTNNWYHAFIVYNDSVNTLKAYLNGTLDATVSSLDITTSHNEIFRFGSYGDSGTPKEFFDGILDECRISNVIRSAEWIATEYNNQQDPANFYSVGLEEYAQDLNPPVIVDFGVVDPGNGNPQFWADVTDDSSGVNSVTMKINNTEHAMNLNGSGYWIYEPSSVNFGDFFITLNYDITAPTVIDWEYYSSQGYKGTFNVNVSDSWGLIDTVFINISTEPDWSGIIDVQILRNTTSGYINDTMDNIIDNTNIWFKVTVNDSNGNNYTSPVHQDFVPDRNYDPIAGNQTLSRDPGVELLPIYSNSTLYLNYSFFDFDDDNETNTGIYWYKNDQIQAGYTNTTQIPSSELFEGDSWYASVIPHDGTTYGDRVNTSIVAISNSPPVLTSYFISPSIPFSFNDLQVNYTFLDSDGDVENEGFREIEWYKDGSIRPDLADSLTALSTKTLLGEVWYFRIRVHDSNNFSIWYQSSNVTIMNSPPTVIGTPTFNKTANIVQTDNLEINYTYFDADNDPEDNTTFGLYVRWYRWNNSHGIVFQYQKNNDTVLSSSETEDGDLWYYILRVFDGNYYSDEFQSDGIAIGFINIKPDVNFLNLTTGSNNNLTIDDLIANYTFSDVNGHNESGTIIVWYLNRTGIENVQHNYTLTQINRDLIMTIPASETRKGDLWKFSVLVKDGIDFKDDWVNSSTIIINNSIPRVDNLTLTAGIYNVTTENLVGDWTFYDDDNYTVIKDSEVYYNITWYKNGQHIASLINKTVVESGNTTKDDDWNFIINVFDGESWSNSINSSIITIENSKPRVTSITFSGGETTNNGINMLYTYVDDDGDSNQTTLIFWTVNGFPENDATGSSSFASSYFIAGDVISCVITPYDGQDNGDTVSNSLVIGNSAPSLIVNTIPQIIGFGNLTTYFSNNRLYVNYSAATNASDPDTGNQLYDIQIEYLDGFSFVTNAIYEWYRNGFIMPISDPFVDLLYLWEGDTWYVRVKILDNYFGASSWYDSPEITIVNSPPEIREQITWDSTFPTDGKDLIISDYHYYDDDGDSEGLTWIQWFINGTKISNDNNTVLSHIFFKKGDNLSVIITPHDGSQYGSPYNSNNVTIKNALPIVTDITINEGQRIFTTNDISLIWEYYDVDGDQENNQSVNIHWLLFNDISKNWELQDLFNDVQIVNSTVTSKGESWKVELRVYDGFNYSIVYNSSIIVIQNSPPVINQVVIVVSGTQGALTAHANDSLIINISYSDVDGDPIVDFRIEWYNNSEFVNNFGIDKIEVTSSYLFKDDDWFFIFLAFDGEDWSLAFRSQSVLIVNSIPSVNSIEFLFDNIDIDPIVQTRDFLVEGENLRIYYQFNDNDIVDENNSTIYWFKDGVKQVQFTNVTTILANYTSPGELWHAMIIPFDGIDMGNPINTSIIRIEGRPVIHDGGGDPRTGDNQPEGVYDIWVLTDVAYNSIDSVDYIITINELNIPPLTFTDLGIGFRDNGTHWVMNNFRLLDQLADYNDFKDLISTNITVQLTIIANDNITDIDIIRYFSINITIDDLAPPRVIDAGYYFDTPSSITFFAEIQEYGNGVNEVIVLYDFFVNTTNSGGSIEFWNSKYFQAPSFPNSRIMESNDTHYVVTLPFMLNASTRISFTIYVSDDTGNINNDAFPQGYIEPGIEDPEPVFPLDIIIATVFIIIIIGSIVSFVAIRKFSTTELVGLDIDKVMEGIQLFGEDEIYASQDIYTLGVVVSVFDQLDGPIPIFVEPLILKDNFNKLLELSDNSFSAIRFVDSFDDELPSTFDFLIDVGVRITSVSFGFALDRPEERGGSENITLNILVHKLYGNLVFQFVDQLTSLVHEIHVIMNTRPSEKEVIAHKTVELRKLVTSILLSYEKMYGPIEEEEEEVDGGE